MEQARFFYKYRNFLYSGVKDHRRLLKNNELYFPSAEKFNDPFDCNIPCHYEEFTHDEFIKYWSDYFKAENSQWLDGEIKQKAEWLFEQHSTPEGKNRVLEIQEGILKELRLNKIGVFSLTPNCSSILSWAHYSDSHKGFCVGFDEEKLRHFVKSKESLDLDSVEYMEQYPIINVYKMTMDKRITKLFWTKSIDWKYEDEYRIIWYDGANKTLEIDSGIIGKVILGCQIRENGKDEIISILKGLSGNISLFQAVTKKDSFGLYFEELKYQL